MRAPRSLHFRVRQQLALLRADKGPIVVAVSGGADSVALAYAVMHGRYAHEGPIVLAHLNHCLRGEESDADEAFVATLPERWRVRCRTEICFRSARLDVADAAARESANVEATARRLRYQWLARLAGEFEARNVVTGHNADDQAETVLHRMLRGAGLRGLRGIAARRRLTEEVVLVRPLLTTSRKEILGYLESEGQEHREDRSNSDPRYLRNRIRHTLLPLLRDSFNPAAATALARLAAQAEEAYKETEWRAHHLLKQAELPRAGGAVVLRLGPLSRAPRFLLRETMRLLWERQGWPLRDMGFDAWERLLRLFHGNEFCMHLPGGLRIERRSQVVVIGRSS